MSRTLEEHLEYISDPVRTAAFRQAIGEVVQNGDVVLDLGCGFGFLGMLCLEAGADRVWGIDQSEAVEIAREVASRSGFGERYRCIRGRSFEVDLPEKVDLVICDHVGFLGFDYGIIALLKDARVRFLKRGGTVMPLAFDMLIAGVSSGRCGRIGKAWRDPAIPANYHWLTEYRTNSKHNMSLTNDEVVTSVASLARIDLTSEAGAMISGRGEVRAEFDTTLDGLGGWFDATLTPGVMMTNSPLASGAIARDQAFLPFDSPLPVREGDVVVVEFGAHHETSILSWSARNARTGERRSQTTWRSKILSGDDGLGTQAGKPALGRRGAVRATIARLIDGKRSATEIERIVARDHPDFLPSEEQMREFVRRELAKLTV